MAKYTTKSKKDQSPNRILDTIYSFRPARVLLTSFELGIFTAIGDSPKESREIAQTLGTSEHATDRLMNALCGMGLLKKKGGRFLNTPLAARYLVKDRPDYPSWLNASGWSLEHVEHAYPGSARRIIGRCSR